MLDGMIDVVVAENGLPVTGHRLDGVRCATGSLGATRAAPSPVGVRA